MTLSLVPALALAVTPVPQAAAPVVAPTIAARQSIAPETAAPELADPLTDPETVTSSPAATVQGRPEKTAGDPLEPFNRANFRRHQKFDRSILRPAAMGYRHVVPKPARAGIRNVFSNFGEPLVFLNYLLQLKFGKAVETAARFLINTGLGFGGLLDVARAPGVKLPHRANGLGDTLGFYGVGPGPYLFLPFVGPTTLRDLIGGQAEGLVLPLAVGTPFDRVEYQIPRGVLTGLDRRAESDAELQALFASAVDPYATLRSVYLQDRQGEIDGLRGRRHAAVDAPGLGEPLVDPAGTAEKPSDTPELSDPLADPQS